MVAAAGVALHVTLCKLDKHSTIEIHPQPRDFRLGGLHGHTQKSKLEIQFLLLTCVSVLPTFCMYTTCVWYPWRPEEGTGFHGSGVVDGYDLPSRCLELNLGLLQEQPAFLSADLLLQPQKCHCYPLPTL